MESVIKKYFLAIIWVALPIVLGAILDHYLHLAWMLLVSIGVSFLLFFIYWFFYQKFTNLNRSIDGLKSEMQNIEEALGASEGEKKLSWSLF